jgi:hypothetical protein
MSLVTASNTCRPCSMHDASYTACARAVRTAHFSGRRDPVREIHGDTSVSLLLN